MNGSTIQTDTAGKIGKKSRRRINGCARVPFVIAAIALFPTGALAQTAGEMREGMAYAAAFCDEDFSGLTEADTDALAILTENATVERDPASKSYLDIYTLSVDHEVPGYSYELKLHETRNKAKSSYRFVCQVTVLDDDFDDAAAQALLADFETSRAAHVEDGSASHVMKRDNAKGLMTLYKDTETDARGCEVYRALVVNPAQNKTIYTVGGLKRDEACGGPSILAIAAEANQ